MNDHGLLMLSSLPSWSSVCALIGTFFLYRKIADIYLLFVELFTLNGPDVRTYGEKGSWAIINGLENDLGTEVALALASQGFSVFLLSTHDPKLETLVQQINSSYPDVQTKVAYMSQEDSSSPLSENYQTLASFVRGLDVAILINNNNKSHKIPVPFISTPQKDIGDIISINCIATVAVTRLIAPGMAQRRRGLILTMGSFNGLFTTPLLATHSGSQAFLRKWSTALAAELKPLSVDVQFVLSSTILWSKRSNWFSPTSGDFVRIVLKKIGKTGSAHKLGWTMTPYWAHAFAQFALQNCPSFTGEIFPTIQKWIQERKRLYEIDHIARQKETSENI